MKSICVATDMDPGADRAVARAVRLAVVHDVPLTVVSVLNDGASEAEKAAPEQMRIAAGETTALEKRKPAEQTTAETGRWTAPLCHLRQRKRLQLACC